MNDLLKYLKVDPASLSPMLAVACNQRYRYVDGQKTDETDGYAIRVVMPNIGYQQLNLKVNSVNDELREALEKSAPVAIAPVGNFTATLYQGAKGVGLSLKADTAEIVKKQQ